MVKKETWASEAECLEYLVGLICVVGIAIDRGWTANEP
jgi:hypothetical protein